METTASTTVTIGERIFNFSNLLGGDWWSFIILTIVAFGFGALMMGRALADTWRPGLVQRRLRRAAGDRQPAVPQFLRRRRPP